MSIAPTGTKRTFSEISSDTNSDDGPTTALYELKDGELGGFWFADVLNASSPPVISDEVKAKIEDLTELDLSNQVHNKKKLQIVLDLLKSSAGTSQLERLSLDDSHIDDLSVLREHPTIRALNLGGCRFANTFPFLPNLEILNLTDCTQLRDLSFLSNYPKLQFLDLENCNNIDFSTVPTLPDLEELSLSGCPNQEALAFLGQSTKLIALVLLGFEGVDFEDLSTKAPGLVDLTIRRGKAFQNIRSLRNFSQLNRLEMRECKQLSVLSLPALETVTELSLKALKDMRSLSFLEKFPALKELECEGIEQSFCLGDRSIASLTKLQKLQKCDISDYSSLPFEADFSSLSRLQEIRIASWGATSKVEMSGLQSLETVRVEHCMNLQTLVLKSLPKLNSVVIDSCISIKDLDISDLEAFPDELCIKNCNGFVTLMLTRACHDHLKQTKGLSVSGVYWNPEEGIAEFN